MLQKTIMSGIGGQGILFSGVAFAWAACWRDTMSPTCRLRR